MLVFYYIALYRYCCYTIFVLFIRWWRLTGLQIKSKERKAVCRHPGLLPACQPLTDWNQRSEINVPHQHEAGDLRLPVPFSTFLIIPHSCNTNWMRGEEAFTQKHPCWRSCSKFIQHILFPGMCMWCWDAGRWAEITRRSVFVCVYHRSLSFNYRSH